MAPQLFHLEGPSLEELKTKVAALYGPRALIVSAELVTVGGIRGVLARKHYEIVVEVPEPDGDGSPRAGASPRSSTTGASPRSGATGGALRGGATGGVRSRDGLRDGSRDGSRGGSAGVSPGNVGGGSLDGAPGGPVDDVPGGPPGGAPGRVVGGASGGASGGGRPRGRRSAATGPSGLDALLQQAELDEVRIAERPDADRDGTPERRSPLPAAVSTDSGLFAALMDELTFATDPPAAPVLSSRRGTPDVPGTRAAGPRRSIAVGRDAVAENPDAGSSGSGAGPGSDATFLREGAGDPTDLPEVRGQVLQARTAEPPAPSVLCAPGDLVVVVGTPAAGWTVAASMATVLGRGAPTAVAVSGPPNWVRPEARSIDDRLEANAARAAGVDGGHAVFVALSSEDPVADGRALLALRPDQVWLAVDAGRKEADTAAWVGALCRSMERAGLAPAGLAVVGSAGTATPETVQALGLPIGWLEGRPAAEAEATAAPSGASSGPRRQGGGRRRAEPAGIE